ncbi:SUF system NifU family Fe-S cluster assembly protein [Nakamurella flavida]|uniref:SUF system NifU family Fe-S cluster assembly protein n=1 Tax=Nakamurella flavida TaxID=363630 RepID=A0A938YKU8_9ACTN|nr:SUF system NifU family Fe-S cluster assembly protein [Nakamurella flavida]MBM9475129.1 SUF system NifU family Fe-S cluster assembly protein [Nakamurella flavida]MDP9776699.1 nitrogen fixation NifU-like protein [Nakamurella flavida]
MQMEQLYQEIILDHYRTPHHNGLREPYGAQVHHVNPTCGDEITLRVELSGTGTDAVVADVSWDAMGCSISQASTSVMTDLVIGRPLGEVLGVLGDFTTMVTSRGTVQGDEEVLGDGIAFAGVAKYPARVKCALLGWMAFKDAAAQVTDGQTTAGHNNEPVHQTEGASR